MPIIMKESRVALICRRLFFKFGFSISEVRKKSTPILPYNMKPSELLIILILLVKKRSDRVASIKSSRGSSYSHASQSKIFCNQRRPPRKCWLCKTWAHRRHLDCNNFDCCCTHQHWKNWVQIVVYISNERNRSLLLLFRFVIRFCFLIAFLFFFGIVSLVTTTLDKFQFQSQVHLSHINVIVWIRFNFKLYAISIEWGSRITFLLVGRQDVINYWDFPH